MNDPNSDALVFFGATGDLAHKKIFPALQAMARRGHLTVPVVGIVHPILGTVTPVHEYEPGTWGPAEADRLTADIGGWHCPAGAS